MTLGFINLFIEQASTYAHYIDGVIWLIFVCVGVWYVISNVAFFKFIMDGRKRSSAEYLEGHEPEIKGKITTSHKIIIALDLAVIAAAIAVWYHVKQQLPPADATVRVIAQQWAWTFQHPGPDGKLDTDDDIHTVDSMHIEVGKTYHYKLVSRDVLHDFSVPVFRLKHDAIPGREITGWFEATKTGKFDIQCAEICGIGHGLMVAELHVHTAEEYAAWVNAAARK